MTFAREKRIPRARFPKTRGVRAVFAFGALSFFPELDSSVAVVSETPAPAALRPHESELSRGSSFAVVASKKTFKTAILRHRVKRRVLNALKRVQDVVDIRGGVIVYPNQHALKARFSDLENALKEIILKLSKKSPDAK